MQAKQRDHLWEANCRLMMQLLRITMIRNLMGRPQRSCKFCLLLSLSKGTLALSKAQVQVADRKILLISEIPGDKMILICRLKNCFMVYALYFYIHASNF